MKIYFVAEGKPADAELSYDFKEIEDCVLVSFQDKFKEDILFSKTSGEWHSVSPLQTINNLTYSNIQEAILKHFKVIG